MNVKQLWYYPPQPHLIPSQLPNSYRYFAHPLLCWMPHRLWKMTLMCPQCDTRKLTSAGAYKTVRKVLKLTGVNLLVGENLECTACKKKWPSWNRDILSQLDIPHRKQFPALLTYRYACDESVVWDRTTGNSPSQLARKLQEEHRRT